MLTHNVASFEEAVIYFNASLLGDGVMVTILLQMAGSFFHLAGGPARTDARENDPEHI